MTVEALTDSNFKEKTQSGISITDFWASWCGPCRMQSPVIDALADDVAFQNINFFKVDVDGNQIVPTEFSIRAIPTLIITKDGKAVETLTGFHNKEQLSEILHKYA